MVERGAGDTFALMLPSTRKDEPSSTSQGQLEITKSAMAAAAQITASMVTVTSEKNPAKISEAYRVIYKTIIDTVKGGQKKGVGA